MRPMCLWVNTIFFVALPNRWKPTPNKPVDPPSNDPPTAALASWSLWKNKQAPAAARLVVPHDSGIADPLRAIDLNTALQYGTAQGYPPLYAFIRQFTRENLHPFVPYKGGPEIILTCGSTDGFSKTIEALSEKWAEGHDPIEEKPGMLVERYCYMNAIQTTTPRGMTIAPVEIDDEGMCAKGPGGLEDVLENWDNTKGRRPHLLYTVTIGQNPTSGTLSVARRTEIYAICVKYDVIIVEDDPYWYLQFPSNAPAGAVTPEPVKSSGFEFLDSLIPSYLSVDYQGRVVRLDTFSKTAAPGCRLGWITTQPALAERLLRITESSTQQPSGFVQAMIAELISGPQSSTDPGRGGAANGSGWKVDGWVRWLEGLRGNYERRMTVMCDTLDANKYIVKAGRRRSLTDVADVEEWAVIERTKIYDFVRPLGGMFIWVRFNFTSHPLRKQVPAARLSQALWIFWTHKPYLVLVSPGTMFAPTPEIRDGDSFNCFRLCFAAINEDEIASISKRFAEGAQDFWKIRSKSKIDKLLEDDASESVEGTEGLAMMGGMC
ncbi:aromatic amino acid aminotransferas-like protein [Massarina eburnea CBS 473.64]|uniref:Aromatic amino acid aminotransferas-like protein n=1 Tax=Massarina eburnea CBS 473.64 TaxID=1395130 RepID=A0A6A6SGU3_9PLEO|nr:aromatic amino acid aminotransferas-like protein [Massarina eburnea CBS 473.64]